MRAGQGTPSVAPALSAWSIRPRIYHWAGRFLARMVTTQVAGGRSQAAGAEHRPARGGARRGRTRRRGRRCIPPWQRRSSASTRWHTCTGDRLPCHAVQCVTSSLLPVPVRVQPCRSAITARVVLLGMRSDHVTLPLLKIKAVPQRTALQRTRLSFVPAPSGWST